MPNQETPSPDPIKQWTTRSAAIPPPLPAGYGLRADLIPLVLAILKANNLIDKASNEKLTLDNLELLTTLLHKKAYDLTDLNAAIDRAIADGVGHDVWQFKKQWVMVTGTGVYDIEQSQLLMAEALGKMLAREGYGVVTGSRPGVDHVVARSYAAALETREVPADRYLREVTVKGQLIDHNYGTAVMIEKNEGWMPYMFKYAFVLIIIGGGNLADRTYRNALRLNVPVLPILQTNGTARVAYAQLIGFANYGVSPESLKTLSASVTTPAEADAIATNISVICREITAGNLSGKMASDYWTLTTDTLKPNNPITYSDDPEEKYGVYVTTRGQHRLALPAQFRMGLYLVTNEFFNEFIKDDGYAKDALWVNVSMKVRREFVRRDKKTPGPKYWGDKWIAERASHPVRGISYYEALAFCRWLQSKFPVDGWLWTLPSEDMWEYAARSTEGRLYPWGNDFKNGLCNSVESKIRTTSSVFDFPAGKSPAGCYDMAGNVWEYVDGVTTMLQECILRGGSFKNNEQEIRSHLRLYGVHRTHRPDDFGFRCALIPFGTITQRQGAKPRAR
jgi:formylglycine-generating enzyme required for sulfatase activity